MVLFSFWCLASVCVFLFVVGIKFSFVVFCFACFCVCGFLVFLLLKLPAWGSLVFTRKRYNRNAHDQIAKGYVENSTENILQKSYQCKQCQNRNWLGYTTFFLSAHVATHNRQLKILLNFQCKTSLSAYVANHNRQLIFLFR